MSVKTNEATGEVTAVIAGKTLQLRATMPRMAAYQAALGTTGIAGIEVMLRMNDARAIYQGFMCLADDASVIEDMLMTPNMDEAVEAIFAALAAGLPDPPKGSEGNGEAAEETTET